MTFSIAAAPFVGTHGSVVGETRVGGIPVGIVDFDARLRGVELHAEGMPYARTRRYGDPSDQSRSTIETGDATIRLYTTPRLAFGIGYGVIASTTDRIAPPGSFTSFADGVRLELHETFDATPTSRLELTVGGLPQAHGTLHVYPGIPGAPDRYDPEAGTQIDAEIRYVARARSRVSFGYGVRYVNQTISYARSTAPADHNAGILPFVQFNLRL
ncbi:MAG: hypothetical protein GIX03_06585 [Candidatus Eremiobacteraeota bacterium]|nr:hypothetical protein [Candidatus Eremiobacteraeota bacterium]MBC5802660.1 hypothetical protein [Candidatus Eremiobacteraeota bacterium]MBC5822039.1 hypothetical protein [Candidatus Eremiobacteraeota bacterium]